MSNRKGALPSPDACQVEPEKVDLGTLLSVRFIWGEGGLQIRSIVGRGYTRPTGSFPSRKLNITVSYDAMLQRDYIYCCEADPKVVDFLPEPFRLEMYTSLYDLVYFPDVAVLRADGSVGVVEIKKSMSEVDRDPFYRSKLDLGASVMESEGFDFAVLDRAAVQKEPRLTNARTICQNRTTRITTAHRMAILEAIGNCGGTIDYGEAVATLGTHDNPECSMGKAILHAMIVQRFVEIDLDKPMTMFSQVKIASPVELSLARATAHLRHH